jgi:hypothetical protein
MPEIPSWDYLLLAHLPRGVAPREFLEHERASGVCELTQDSRFQVLRAEALAPTPNSFYPATLPEQRKRTAEVEFFIEFIAVRESTEALSQYRDLMSTYFGPLNGHLVNEGMLYNFVALETTEVLFQADGVPPWNQIHISGDFPEYKDLDWDSLYGDLFRRLFSEDLAVVWAEVPKIRETPPYYTGRLLEDLHVAADRSPPNPTHAAETLTVAAGTAVPVSDHSSRVLHHRRRACCQDCTRSRQPPSRTTPDQCSRPQLPGLEDPRPWPQHRSRPGYHRT